MPNSPHIRCRTIDVEAGQLPAPATKLIITQVLQASQDPPFWAWIIVAAFYDRDGKAVWSTELFAAHLDIQFESDSEEEEGSESGSETQSEESGFALETHSPQRDQFSSSAAAQALHHQTHSEYQVHSQPPHFPVSGVINTPVYWDPTTRGAVPGYWQASYDPALRRWVHTWQPLS